MILGLVPRSPRLWLHQFLRSLTFLWFEHPIYDSPHCTYSFFLSPAQIPFQNFQCHFPLFVFLNSFVFSYRWLEKRTCVWHTHFICWNSHLRKRLNFSCLLWYTKVSLMCQTCNLNVLKHWKRIGYEWCKLIATLGCNFSSYTSIIDLIKQITGYDRGTKLQGIWCISTHKRALIWWVQLFHWLKLLTLSYSIYVVKHVSILVFVSILKQYSC